MSTTNTLKRSLNALKRLRSDTAHMVPMDMYKGMGNILVRTYTALHEALTKIIDDPIVASLSIELPEDANDRQKVTQVAVLTGQLLSYVEDYYEEIRSEEMAGEEPLSEEEKISRRFNKLMDDN